MSGFESGGILTADTVKNAYDKMTSNSNLGGGEAIMKGEQIVTLYDIIGKPCPYDNLELESWYFVDRNGITKVE